MNITTQIHDTLHAWIKAVTGLSNGHIIPDKENSPEPVGNFFVINSTVSDVPIGLEDEVAYTASGQYTLRAIRERRASLHAYGPNALALMGMVQLTPDLPSVRRLFAAARLAVIDVGNVQDLSALKSARYEQRAQMDVRLRYSLTLTEAVTTIDSIQFDVSVNLGGVIETVSGQAP